MNIKLAALSAALLFAIVGNANASQDVKTFEVKIQVNGTCKLVKPADIDLGSHTSDTATVAKQAGSIDLNCTKGLGYSLAITSGNAWSMKSGTNSLPYVLADSGATVQLTSPKTGNGNGMAAANVIKYGIDAIVANNALLDLPVGTYVDTVTATVTF